jgi:hypothetical protein
MPGVNPLTSVCTCGNTIKNKNEVDQTLCNIPCSGNEEQMCGNSGGDYANLYWGNF